jgi:threonine dehydratase
MNNNTTASTFTPPTLDEIRAARDRIAPYVVRTPVHHWRSPAVETRFPPGTEIHLKLELFQRTGTFKARGAVNNALALDAEARRRGITAISAGNHAIAAAYAAKCVGAHAKVVMMATANPARVAAARALGAEVLISPDGATGFAMVEEIARNEGRTFIHPFEGPRVTEATGTCGLELHEQVRDLDAVVVPIGAGGLCSGIGTVTKLVNPRCKVYGVEPEATQVMTRSLAAGSAQKVGTRKTIADSLAPPMTTPYCFEMNRRALEEVVLVSDDEMAAAAAILFSEMKLALEAAAAASTAAAFGPLRAKLAGKRVALVVCGANIDLDNMQKLVARGQQALADRVLAA